LRLTIWVTSFRLGRFALSANPTAVPGWFFKNQALTRKIEVVIFTIQNGPAPEVKIEGAGLEATVTAGACTIRFSQDKLVLGTIERSGRASASGVGRA
jgi:hypothetical protein